MDKPGVRQVTEGSGERKNGENSSQNHLWCPNDPRSSGIDDDDDDDDEFLLLFFNLYCASLNDIFCSSVEHAKLVYTKGSRLFSISLLLLT